LGQLVPVTSGEVTIPQPTADRGWCPASQGIHGSENVAQGGVMASFSDDFNRANDASLGANWTEDAGQASIVSNTLRSSPLNTPKPQCATRAHPRRASIST
jgi:hypothetical protein